MSKKMFYIDFVNNLREYIDKNADSLGFEILFGDVDKGYFTVQDKLGYRAYCQASRFNKGLDVGISFKPNSLTGSSCHVAKPSADIDNVIEWINISLKEATAYPKDLRMPKSKSDRYIV